MADKKLLDIEQLTLKKRDYSRTLLIIGAVVMAFFTFMGVIDAIGDWRPGWNG